MGEPLIEYRKIGLLATCIGNERIRIDADGSLHHARNRRECEPGGLWSSEWRQVGKLDAGDLEALLRAIRATGLLALPAEMVDEAAEGGRREELLVMIDAVAHRFVVQNSDHPAFRKAVQLIWGTLAGAV
jgi:hypothetical protein